jgi:hypothetical protein
MQSQVVGVEDKMTLEEMQTSLTTVLMVRLLSDASIVRSR